MRGRLRGLAVLCLLLSAGACTAAAQGAATLPARVRAVRGVAVTGLSDLEFGSLLPTATKTVAPDAGGRFRIGASRGGRVIISYVLPADLGSPSVSVGSWAVRYNEQNDYAGSTGVPIPGLTGSYQLMMQNGDELFLWLGATLTTTAASPGSYSAPIVVTVAYN